MGLSLQSAAMSDQPRRNIEIKARCDDLIQARERAEALGAKFAGVLNQIDTYFHVPHGRLKLRQINSDRTELIWYRRPQAQEARPSDYFVVPISDAATMLSALTAALGVRGTVRKRRNLLLWKNVRIHMDQVESLGTFIELEAVVSESDDENVSRARIDELIRELAIEDLIAVSYSDLLGF